MLIIALSGFALLVVIAVVVGVEDAVRAPHRRLRAAERRERWEARRDDRESR